jgi:hypothetical protein
MPFHIAAFAVAAGVNDNNVDVPAVADTIFTVRNNHFILTEQYNLLYAFAHGASILRARFNTPTLNAIARYQIWPVERSATIPDDPRGLDLRDMPLAIPLNEEIAVEESGNLGAATEREAVFIWLGTPDWSRNLPRNQYTLAVRFTATIAVNANAWSADVPITFTENLRGGFYDVLGAWVVGSSDLAFRFVFPRAQFAGQRQLRPGGLCQDSVGNTDWMGNDALGYWGSFHSFEAPTLSVFALAAGATAIEGRLLLGYPGKSV